MTKFKKMTKVFGLVLLFIFVIFVVFDIGMVFSGQIILPQVLSLGAVSIHYYGVILGIAVLVGYYLAKKNFSSCGLTTEHAEELFFWIMLGGFLGARLYHVFSSVSYYYLHPVDIIKVWQGGLSIYGAVLGGVMALWVYVKGALRLKPKSTFDILNWLTPSLILGQIIGRFGNFFNYEAYGYPTNLPWKMFVPWEFRPAEYQQHFFFHPWFLYEQIGLLVILFIISRIKKHQKNVELVPKLHLFIWYVLLYNILRFGLEFLRIDSTYMLGFRQNSLVSIGLVCLSMVYLIRTYIFGSFSSPLRGEVRRG